MLHPPSKVYIKKRIIKRENSNKQIFHLSLKKEKEKEKNINNGQILCFIPPKEK